ncbi:MAG: hypothetical protein Q7T03_08740 [Deltaproteobacteria bacterium]|nr:hypothetical protein [Deltaproteobacteria bacterium]
MSKTFNGLGQFKNIESFIQVNTIKGFKYIDRAGELVNYFHDSDLIPQFSMGLNGLVVKQPKDKIEELKVTSQMVWAKFTKVDSLDMISDLFVKELKNILKILEIEEVVRIGWRNYLIYELSNKEGQEGFLQKIVSAKKMKASLLRFKLETEKDFDANLIIQPVIKNDDLKTHAILFDIDIFEGGKRDADEILKILKTFREYLANDDGFLSGLNDSF